MTRPSDKLAAATLKLQRGEAEGQTCKLHIGRTYLYRGKRVRYLRPAIKRDGTWGGWVEIYIGTRRSGAHATVRPSALKEVAAHA